MHAEQVAEYLRLHPQFFEDYAEMLAEITLPHPETGRAVPIIERQLTALREKNRHLEAKFLELLQFGEQNDLTSERLHRLTLAWMQAANVHQVLDVLQRQMHDTFGNVRVALRVWGAPAPAEGLRHLPMLQAVSPEVVRLADNLTQPYCGGHVPDEVRAWFEHGSDLASFAQLRMGDTWGMLVLGSVEPKRFFPDMGSLYLTRLAELLTAALQRCLVHG